MVIIRWWLSPGAAEDQEEVSLHCRLHFGFPPDRPLFSSAAEKAKLRMNGVYDVNEICERNMWTRYAHMQICEGDMWKRYVNKICSLADMWTSWFCRDFQADLSRRHCEGSFVFLAIICNNCWKTKCTLATASLFRRPDIEVEAGHEEEKGGDGEANHRGAHHLVSLISWQISKLQTWKSQQGNLLGAHHLVTSYFTTQMTEDLGGDHGSLVPRLTWTREE